MTVLEQKDHVERVLVVENDKPTLKLICDHLAADRFLVTGARSTDEATSHLEADKFDMVLLDLNSGDGLDTLREIRGSENDAVSRVAVIILSGRSTERDRVKGLGEGADDYIAKPFSYSELLARMNAVLRRTRLSEPITKAGEIQINHTTGHVTVSGREVRLSVKELAILKMLAKEPTRVFSHEEILAEIWGYRSMGHKRTLEAHCSRLSRKLDPDTGRFVVNCWGVGRRLLGP